ELHGGTVTCRSDGPGQGSCFTVRLPRLVREHAPVERRRGDRSLESGGARLKVVVVDDNKDAAATLATLLEMMGHSVRHVHDGDAAVHAAAEFDPKVVLLDIGMPKLNGYEACRRIRLAPGGRDRVLVAVTGWGQPEDQRRSHEAGFDHHLVKPIEPAAIESLITDIGSRRALGGWQMTSVDEGLAGTGGPAP
ncbi:MAG: Multidomain signal transduction protein including CheB-like methylesterase, CheR-like methyltransferase and BaeS-like histidine kinase, partial [uncultured Ramlibacter sp.]